MGSQSEVMHCYEQIAGLTDGMLTLVSTRQWGELPAQEHLCASLVDYLKGIEALESLSETQVARKYQLLQRIISNQTEVSRLVMPQLAHLGKVLKSLEQQDSLQKTYGQVNDIFI